jgi:hypothetical protein
MIDIIKKAIDVSEAIGELPPKPKPCYYDDPYLGYQKEWVISMVGSQYLAWYESYHNRQVLKKLERDYDLKDWHLLPMMDSSEKCPFMVIGSCSDQIYLLLKVPDWKLDKAYMSRCSGTYLQECAKPTLPPVGFLMSVDTFLTRVEEFGSLLASAVEQKKGYTRHGDEVKHYYYYFSEDNTTIRELDTLDLSMVKGLNPPIFLVGYKDTTIYFRDVIEMYLA